MSTDPFVLRDLGTEVRVIGLLNLTVDENVTGPSNCESSCLDLPPSTRILSLTITSSNTTLSVFGS